MEADIETGAERELTAEKFFNIKSIERLPGGTELLLTASRIPNKHFRIWRISIVSGTAEPTAGIITKNASPLLINTVVCFLI